MKPVGAPSVRVPDAPASDLEDSRAAASRPEEREDSSACAPPASPSALLIVAFVEYQRRCREGRPPDVQEWCEQFPFPSSCRSALRKTLEMEIKLSPFLDRFSPVSDVESIPWPTEGEQRAGFTILRELARGSFARVYLASEPSTGDRLVVLKCSLLGDAEARTMGRLSHPGIVPILSARREERSGLALVCMPYLGSATLEDVLARLQTEESPPRRAAFILDVIRSRGQPEDPPLPVADTRLQQGSYADGVIHLAAQLAETLAFLHERGVSHRDLKPSNVLLDPSGKPLLLDFNLSDSERESTILIGGTLRYMAPEQLHAYLEKRKEGLDERIDLYALGVMVYELLAGVHPCGRLPANATEPVLAQSLLEGMKAGFRSFRDICPELERPVAAILDRCLAIEGADRPSSAAELAAELKRQFAPARQLRRWMAARQRSLLTALTLLVGTVAVLAYLWAVTPPYSQREYDRGRIAYRAGDFDAAEMHFEHAVRAEPNNERFRFARGCARLQLSKYLPPDRVKFDQIWEDLASKEQGAADARTLAVNAYLLVRKQHFEEAITVYSSPALLEYRPVMVRNNRAYSYISIGRLKEAQTDLDRVIQMDSYCLAARYNRARVAMRMRMKRKIPAIPAQALEDMEQALQWGPMTTSALSRDAALLYALAAEDHHQQGHFERALSYLRQAIAAGEPPAKFHPIPILQDALKRPEFAALVNSQPVQMPPQPDLRLIDPVEFSE